MSVEDFFFPGSAIPADGLHDSQIRRNEQTWFAHFWPNSHEWIAGHTVSDFSSPNSHATHKPAVNAST